METREKKLILNSDSYSSSLPTIEDVLPRGESVPALTVELVSKRSRSE